MTSITKANEKDFQLLADIGKQSFLESHGHSAPTADINKYVSETYTNDVSKEELRNSKNIYHIIYHEGQPAGYSKIIFDTPHSNIPVKIITKLERIYLLKLFYGMDAGKQLFDHNVNLSKDHHQLGMWLHVWIENHRAFAFYVKQGFKIIGRYDFEVSPTHFNPNHVMYLNF